MTRLMIYAGMLLFSTVLFAGCGNPKTEKTEGDAGRPPETPTDTAERGDSGHPSEGPHHGDLIELGQEEYHAELLHPEHGETSAVTIYILDGSATKQVPIDAKNVTINVTHDGKPEQFTLDANPDEGDPQGQSSRFTSNEADLLKHFGEEEIEGRLVVKIHGKSFSGKISHSHDHAGHHH